MQVADFSACFGYLVLTLEWVPDVSRSLWVLSATIATLRSKTQRLLTKKQKMASFKKTQELLLPCLEQEIIDDEVYVLANLPFQPVAYKKFSLKNKNSAECKADFYVDKRDIVLLFEVLGVPLILKCCNGTICDGNEGLYVAPKRFPYPCHYSDMMPISGRLVLELSMISNQVTDWICNTNRRKVTQWNHGILNPPWIAKYEDGGNSKGAALDNCFCFIDGTVWPISWRMSNQWVVYNGHKRMHAFKFQAVRLIANMKEHSYVSFHLSLLKLAALTIFKITSLTTFPHIKKISIKNPSDRCWKYLISSTLITLVIKLISREIFC